MQCLFNSKYIQIAQNEINNIVPVKYTTTVIWNVTKQTYSTSPF